VVVKACNWEDIKGGQWDMQRAALWLRAVSGPQAAHGLVLYVPPKTFIHCSL
jgi:hypothetical protein